MQQTRSKSSGHAAAALKPAARTRAIARRPKVIFTPLQTPPSGRSHRNDDRQYIISATRLGQQVISWAEPLWEGSFSITDLSGYRTIAAHGALASLALPVHESNYVCDSVPFSQTVWGLPQAAGESWDDWGIEQPQFALDLLAFSRLPLRDCGKDVAGRDLSAAIVVSADSEELDAWRSERHRLPFWQEQLALPSAAQCFVKA